jgi:hypothetical protein
VDFVAVGQHLTGGTLNSLEVRPRFGYHIKGSGIHIPDPKMR